jgi:Spy/CpxP family protein refolding chaperone
MNANDYDSIEKTGFFANRLISWPLALVGLTVALLLVANSVSAWGRRDSHELDDIKSHVDHFLDRALDRLDATDEQGTAIRAIIMSSIDDLHGARGEFQSSHEEFRDLLMADTIDRAALEQLRLDTLSRTDKITRILTNNLTDVIEQLTPEQRRKLEERFEKHKGRLGHGHGRWGRH